jgi:excinuclease ABC subunit A
VPDESKSLAEGAIKSWWAKIRRFASFSISASRRWRSITRCRWKAPFEALPEAFKHALFHGTGEIAIDTGWQKTEQKAAWPSPSKACCRNRPPASQRRKRDALRSTLTRLMNRIPVRGVRETFEERELAVYLSSKFQVSGFKLASLVKSNLKLETSNLNCPALKHPRVHRHCTSRRSALDA